MKTYLSALLLLSSILLSAQSWRGATEIGTAGLLQNERRAGLHLGIGLDRVLPLTPKTNFIVGVGLEQMQYANLEYFRAPNESDLPFSECAECVPLNYLSRMRRNQALVRIEVERAIRRFSIGAGAAIGYTFAGSVVRENYPYSNDPAFRVISTDEFRLGERIERGNLASSWQRLDRRFHPYLTFWLGYALNDRLALILRARYAVGRTEIVRFARRKPNVLDPVETSRLPTDGADFSVNTLALSATYSL